VDIELIKLNFLYNPSTGIIQHKRNGKVAFSTMQNTGHMHGAFMGKFYKAHRVAWVIYYGTYPKNDVDHINGIRHDNRIENLRDVKRSTNMMNSKMYSRNTSGKSGVSRSENVWRVQTKVNGVWHRSSFAKFEDACIYRDSLFSTLGFSERHGKEQISMDIHLS
jgi:HNH endonuclease